MSESFRKLKYVGNIQQDSISPYAAYSNTMSRLLKSIL